MASKLVTRCTELGALSCLGYDIVFNSTSCQCVRKFNICCSVFLESFVEFNSVCNMKNNRVELHLDLFRRPLLPRNKSCCASVGHFVKLRIMTKHLCPVC